MNALREFFSPEAGQRRRNWLMEQDARIANALRYALGPQAYPLVEAGAQGMNMLAGGADHRDAVQSSGDLMRAQTGAEALRAGATLGAATLSALIPGVSNRLVQEGVETARRVSVDDRGLGLFGVNVDGRPAGSIQIADGGGGGFVSSAYLEPQFTGKRFGVDAYDQIEAILGRRLGPSPLGLSANARPFWRRRLAAMDPAARQEALASSYEAGVRAGVPESDVRIRLYEVGGGDALDAIDAYLSRQSATPAQDVARLLRDGRAAEVTDDMMARVDPQEMHRLYESGATGRPMPMDEASRMGRAREMGFDPETTYHGTRQDFAAVDPNTAGDNFAADVRGFFSTNDPRAASEYATGNTVGLPADGGSVMPLRVRRNNNLIADDYFFRSEGMAPYRNDDVVGVWDIYQDFLNEQADAVRASGVTLVSPDMAAPSGAAQNMDVMFDPRNIRSRFARFDPRLSHLANLSAAGAGVATAGALASQPEGHWDQAREYLRQHGFLE